MANMTAELRATAYVRRLRVGDQFTDADGTWEVTRIPQVVDGKEVHVYLIPVPKRGKRSRVFIYGMGDRVKLA